MQPETKTRCARRRCLSTDAVIIGGGWTGLLMAKELAARTPLSIVVLERGAARHKEDYVGGMDELDYNVRFRLMQDYSLQTVTLRYTHARTAPFPIRQLGSFMPGQGTGGAGEHWGAVFPRFHAGCFRAAHQHHAKLRREKAARRSLRRGLGHHLGRGRALLHARR